jgi:hypothetical protein
MLKLSSLTAGMSSLVLQKNIEVQVYRSKVGLFVGLRTATRDRWGGGATSGQHIPIFRTTLMCRAVGGIGGCNSRKWLSLGSTKIT